MPIYGHIWVHFFGCHKTSLVAPMWQLRVPTEPNPSSHLGFEASLSLEDIQWLGLNQIRRCPLQIAWKQRLIWGFPRPHYPAVTSSGPQPEGLASSLRSAVQMATDKTLKEAGPRDVQGRVMGLWFDSHSIICEIPQSIEENTVWLVGTYCQRIAVFQHCRSK